jgi:hypothetical protein
MKRLGRGKNNAVAQRTATQLHTPTAAQKANRVVAVLFLMGVFTFMLWALWSNLTTSSPPEMGATGPLVLTPQASDFVLLQDARVNDTAERLELEREQERVAAELAQISAQIEQADQQQQLGLLREQQRLELERQQIGNLIAQWDAERQRQLNDAQAQAQAIELEAQAQAAGEVARAEAVERTAEAQKRQAEAAQAQAVAEAISVAAFGVAVVVVLATAVLALGSTLAGLWVLLSVARREAQMRLAAPLPTRATPIEQAFFERAQAPQREPAPEPRPEVNTVITGNYDLLREYLTAQQIGLLPDIERDDVPEWAVTAMRRMVADGHSRTLISTLFGLTGRHYALFRQLVDEGVGR